MFNAQKRKRQIIEIAEKHKGNKSYSTTITMNSTIKTLL